jgi:cytochrome c oxidase assembly protein subunit 15
MLAQRLQWLRRLSLLCVAMTVLLMGLGAWVKANGAGLSCPDWPQCYGAWLPPFPSSDNGGTYHGQPVGYTQAQILYEWTHRAVVSLLLVPLLAYAGLAVASKEVDRTARTLPVVGLGLYVAQAGLGAVTVVTGNPPWATTMHLLTATIFLTTLTVAACWIHLRPLAEARPEAAPPPKPRTVSYVYQDEAASHAAAETEAVDA